MAAAHLTKNKSKRHPPSSFLATPLRREGEGGAEKREGDKEGEREISRKGFVEGRREKGRRGQ